MSDAVEGGLTESAAVLGLGRALLGGPQFTSDELRLMLRLMAECLQVTPAADE
ncbi:hypothetical protein [Streptomyces sp. WAC 06725]|uniref:hypothetical protein n=1 Tax=Streptomyces sp. WAC 06725 TaxID=2203209 RepID=UPI00163CE17A|nr:hypothetical protein [Streptomyces sp. WAC 06725]